MWHPTAAPALLLLILSAHLSAALPNIPPQPPLRNYIDTVCKPPILRSGELLPPCVSVESTEALCHPNGTAPLYLEAHAQCLCHGSFFAEWAACAGCLSLHGALDDADRTFHLAVAASASSVLCGFLSEPASPAPTATFKALLRSIEAGMPGRPENDSIAAAAQGSDGPGPGDKAPFRTEISLYYTAIGPQGPGPITGDARSATATRLSLATGQPPPFSAPSPNAAATPFGPSSTGMETRSTASPVESRATSPGLQRALLKWMALAVVLVVIA